MKPPRFEYYDPPSLDEAIALLDRFGDEAKVLAGGQSLVPVLNMRLARPRALIDLNRIESLRFIRIEEGQLRIGAMTRHREVERSEAVASALPILREAIEQVGHVQIRTRGTLGGSLAHADPAAELPAIATLLDAELVAVGPNGARSIPAREFFVMVFMTSLDPREILTEVRFPLLPPRTGTCFMEVARRHGDFALAGVGCYLTLDVAGRIERAGIALTGVGLTPVRAGQAEAALAGRTPSPELFERAAAAVSEEIDPSDDVHATAEYRRHVAGVLTRRALQTALARAGRGAAAGAGGNPR